MMYLLTGGPWYSADFSMFMENIILVFIVIGERRKGRKGWSSLI